MFSMRDGDDGEDAPEKISLDDLYEGKQKRDLRILNTFKTVLTRVHNQIKLTSRQKIDQQFCWFVVPEFILGVPSYNNQDCVVYIIEKLTDNGFQVKYTHPNLLLISWQHWVPGYVRKELKKKTGMEIDGHGKYVNKPANLVGGSGGVGGGRSNDVTDTMAVFGRSRSNGDANGNASLPDLYSGGGSNDSQPAKQFRDTKTYTPSGGLVYKDQLLQDLRQKLSS